MSELSVEKIKQAINDTDGTLKSASAYLGVKYNTLQYWVLKYNIPFNNKNKINATPEQLWESYKELSSAQLVADKFGCTKSGVLHVLRKNGYTVNGLTVYSLNDDFFYKESERLFYWMGFIAADGCVKELHGKYGKSRYELSIGLSIRDKDHLEKFKNHITYNGQVRDYIVKNSKRNPNWNDSKKSEIKITINNKLFNRFAEFNIVPRKSLKYNFPEWLIDHPMVHHFMRGYFDGDGSWYIDSSKKTPQVFFSLRGTAEFLEVYRSILEKYGMPQRLKDIRINSGIGVLEYGGNGHTCKLRDFLYKDSSVFMKRKYNVVKNIAV